MTTKKVLVLDDDPTILKTLFVMLGNGYQVKTVGSGQEALKVLEAEKGAFDILIVDIMMPGSSGANFYLAVMKEYPGLEERILFMTGGPYDAFIEQFSISNPCIKKPFSKQELQDALDKISK